MPKPISNDAGHGFLVRGTLRPSLGATTGFTRGLNGPKSTRRPVVRPSPSAGSANNRIPGSIQVRKQ